MKGGETANNVFAAFDAKNKIGIYALNPTGGPSEQALIEETLKNALRVLYSSDYQDYQWKDSDDFSDAVKWSKYETARFARVGFDKKSQQTVHLQLVRLSFNQKDVLAGFVYELKRGAGAEQHFNGWIGGGNGDASDALLDLITKITGEKKPEGYPGAPPPGLGGPPPGLKKIR